MLQIEIYLTLAIKKKKLEKRLEKSQGKAASRAFL